MRNFIVDEPLLMQLMQYLVSRPYMEVFDMMDRLKQSKVAEVENTSADSGTSS